MNYTVGKGGFVVSLPGYSGCNQTRRINGHDSLLYDYDVKNNFFHLQLFFWHNLSFLFRESGASICIFLSLRIHGAGGGQSLQCRRNNKMFLWPDTPGTTPGRVQVGWVWRRFALWFSIYRNLRWLTVDAKEEKAIQTRSSQRPQFGCRTQGQTRISHHLDIIFGFILRNVYNKYAILSNYELHFYWRGYIFTE